MDIQTKQILSNKVSVIFATRGRPDILKSAVDSVSVQTVKPKKIIISCVSEQDIGNIDQSLCHVIFGDAGLPRQRNAGLENLPQDTEFVVFMDDDFIAHEKWIEEALVVFEGNPDIACITGTMLADGINGRGLEVNEALALNKNYKVNTINSPVTLNYSPYGCNMAFRMASIKGMKFDERLVLYGWQEDRDFGGQVANNGGQLVKIPKAVGVHLGVKSGRVKGEKLGYSQVANPVYLAKKGTMSSNAAFEHIISNFAMNLIKSFFPEPYVDRFGRLKGNIIGFYDIIRGRSAPERAKQL